MLKRLGSRRLYLYQRKVVVIIDTTHHEKTRSRGKKKRMPSIGKVVLNNIPCKEKVLGPGYQEIWIGVLLKDRSCLGLTRFLFSDKVSWFRSQGLLEEIEIRKIQDLIKEALKRDVILVAEGTSSRSGTSSRGSRSTGSRRTGSTTRPRHSSTQTRHERMC